jgi:hypothetical protein
LGCGLSIEKHLRRPHSRVLIRWVENELRLASNNGHRGSLAALLASRIDQSPLLESTAVYGLSMDIEHFEIAKRPAFDMESEYRRLGLDPSYRLDDDPIQKTAP